jgi:uncharacterized protein YbjT (DUF2867 family)
MSILVTGATGTIGSLIVERLAAAGAEVKALVRTPGKVSFPKGVTEVAGDLTNVAAMRTALSSVRTLFLLNAVVADEVTQALITLNLARDAGIERIVYLSVIHADRYTNVPHFTGKHTVERMIEDLKLPATVLRPAYFMQNDRQVKPVIENHGIYPMPIGSTGVCMVDARDIADLATTELLERDRAQTPLPRRTLDLVGPEALSGDSVARIWSEELQREVRYGGNDVEAFERQMATFTPAWMAYDMRLMMGGIQNHGMRPEPGTVETLQKQLGRPLRTYRNFVREMLNAKS